MSQETVEKTPALTASQSSWRCVQARDKDGWLALMADDVLIEDPIGPSPTNPDGTGVRGKDAVASFFDSTIGITKSMKITCEETFPSGSPDEIAHILLLQFEFEGGFSQFGAGHLHLPNQRRRPADQSPRLLEHGHDEVREARRPTAISQPLVGPRRRRRRRFSRHRSRGGRTARRAGRRCRAQRT